MAIFDTYFNHRKTLCQSLFFNNGFRPATLLKKRLWYRCFQYLDLYMVALLGYFIINRTC